MFEKVKYKPQFPYHGKPFHNHCNPPDINININNNGDDENDLSPVLIDLINRINNVEHDVEDLSLLSGSSIELGENENQAYPGIKGKQNEIAISLLNERIEDKANKDEVPEPEVYYTNSLDYPDNPSISGIYINLEGTMKFWNNLDWIDITLERSNNIGEASSDNEIPTAKAVYNAVLEVSKKSESELKNYVKETEVQELINKAIENNDSEDDDLYDELLNSIIDFNEKIN